MRISELSAASGVPVSTIKYYLREGLLPRGKALSATRASYDETHTRRLRLLTLVPDKRRVAISTLRAALESLPHNAIGAVAGAEWHPPHPLAGAARDAGAWLDPETDELYRRGVELIVRADALAMTRACPEVSRPGPEEAAPAWNAPLQRLATGPYLDALREARPRTQ